MSAHLVALRPVGWRDAAFCRAVAALSDVRAVSFDERKPTLRGHLGWMLRHHYGQDRAYIVELRPNEWWHRRIGVTTLHPRNGKIWIGIALVPEWRSMGYGTMAIALTGREGLRHFQAPIFAAIRAGNLVSRQAFLNAGFCYEQGQTDSEGGSGWVLMMPHQS